MTLITYTRSWDADKKIQSFILEFKEISKVELDAVMNVIKQLMEDRV